MPCATGISCSSTFFEEMYGKGIHFVFSIKRVGLKEWNVHTLNDFVIVQKNSKIWSITLADFGDTTRVFNFATEGSLNWWCTTWPITHDKSSEPSISKKVSCVRRNIALVSKEITLINIPNSYDLKLMDDWESSLLKFMINDEYFVLYTRYTWYMEIFLHNANMFLEMW